MIGVLLTWSWFLAEECSIYLSNESNTNPMVFKKTQEPSCFKEGVRCVKDEINVVDDTSKVHSQNASNINKDKLKKLMFNDIVEDKLKLKPVESYTLLPHCTNSNVKNNAQHTKSSNSEEHKYCIVNNLRTKEEYEKKHKYVFSDKAKVELNCVRAILNTIDTDYLNINTASEFIKDKNDKSELEYEDNIYHVSKARETKTQSALKDPNMKTPITGRYDSIMRKIKDAYAVCSCKICNCLGISTSEATKADVCNCKPCDCPDCQKYKFNLKTATKPKSENPKLCKTNIIAENTAEPCNCKPCQCDTCKLTAKVNAQNYNVTATNVERKWAFCKYINSDESIESTEPLGKDSSRHTAIKKLKYTRNVACGENRQAYSKCTLCKSCINEACRPDICDCDKLNINRSQKNITVSRKFSSVQDAMNNKEKYENYEKQGNLSNNYTSIKNMSRNNKKNKKCSDENDNFENETTKCIKSNLKPNARVENCAQCYEEGEPESVTYTSLSTCLRPFINGKFYETRHCETVIGTQDNSGTKGHQTYDFVWPFNVKNGRIDIDTVYGNQKRYTKASQNNNIPCHFMKCEKYMMISQSCNTVSEEIKSEIPHIDKYYTVLPLIAKHQSCTESNKLNSRTKSNAPRPCCLKTHLNKNVRTTIDPVTVSKPAIDKTILYKTFNNLQNNVSALSSCSECSSISNKKHKSIESCNSSGHDCSDYLIRFPRNTVENCINDVMKDFGKNISLTRLHVAITSKNDNSHSKVFFPCKKKPRNKPEKPFKHASVIQEKVSHGSTKPNRGQIIQAKVCKYWSSRKRCDCQPCDCDGCPHEREKYNRCRCDCVACSCYGTCLSEDKSVFIRKNQNSQTENNLSQCLQNCKTYCQIGIETESTPRASNARGNYETLYNNTTVYKTLEQAKAFSSELMKILEKCDMSMTKVANPSNHEKPEVKRLKSVAIQTFMEDSSNLNRTLVDNGVQSFASENLVTKDVERFLNNRIKEANVNTSFESLYNARRRKSELVPFPSSQYTTNFKMDGALKLDLNMVPADVDKYLNSKNETRNMHIPLLNAIKNKSSENQTVNQDNIWYDKDGKKNVPTKYRVKVVPKDDDKSETYFATQNDETIDYINGLSINPHESKYKHTKTRQQHMPEYIVSVNDSQNHYNNLEEDNAMKEQRAKLLSKWIDTVTEVNKICGEYKQRRNSKMAEKQNSVDDSDATLINTALFAEIHNWNPRTHTLGDNLTNYNDVNKDPLDLDNKIAKDSAKETSQKNLTDTAKNMVEDKMNHLTQLFNNEIEVLFDRPHEIIKTNSRGKPTARENDISEATTSGYRKINFRGLLRVSDHTILVRWDPPKDLKDVQGYELLVDGKAVQQLGPSKCLAVVTSLPNTDRVVLTIRTISSDPKNRQQSSIPYYNRRLSR